MQNSVTVAAVIPVHRATYLGECLGSVLAQTRRADQVIVVDDGTPDIGAFEDVARAFAGRITLIRQHNQGAGAARNAGILASRSDLIAFLDSDDAWEPTFLEEQVGRLESAPDCTLVYANARIVGNTPLAGQLFMDGAPSRGEVTVESLLNQQCTVVTSSVVVRREALIDVGLFDVALRRGQDFDLWVRLAHRGARVAYTTTPLVSRRVHGENLSGDRVSELQRALSVLHALSTKLTLTRAERHALMVRLAQLRAWIRAEEGKQQLAAGRIEPARAAFREAASLGAGWKIQAASAGLRFAPRVTHFLCRLRTRRLPVPVSFG